jgi:1,4-dihydroxy-2-naphthoate octaprenyltransferase
MLKTWIEAARPKTLFVGVAPVLAATALARADGVMQLLPAAVCFLFALLAQITSNLVNDYFDFRHGADTPDRLGPERAVAAGKISPRAMLTASIVTMAIALALGLTLVWYGGWWLILVGAAVALGAFAYSGGPYPLAYHGLGDVAVVIFYGLVPVAFTYYVQALTFTPTVWLIGLAIGLVGTNVLIVNNYRDMETDAAAGKRTTVVRFGRKAMGDLYLADCAIAACLLIYALGCSWLFTIPFALFSLLLHTLLRRLQGRALNKVLGLTAFNVLLYALTVVAAV